jgi:glycerophosphoryl diester phosphodiesterase
LDEVLGRFPSTHLNIDLKTDQPGLITAVRDIIRRRSAHSRATIASFIPNALESFRMLSPEVPTSAHPEEVRTLVLHRFRSMFGAERPELVAERVQIPQHHRGLPLAGRGFIGFFHRIGLAVDVWTINDPRVARRLARRGVDGIVTDHVKIIQEAIGADR